MTQRNMKENQHVQPIVDVEAGTVTFRTKGHPDQVLEWAKLSPTVQKRAGLVGMAQVRIVDAAAVPMTDDDGNILSESTRIQMKFDRMGRLIEHYHTGTEQWTLQQAGGGGRSITIEAIARVKGMDYDTAKAEVEKFAVAKHGGDTKAALAFFRGSKSVSEAMQAIRAERMPAPKVDADKALTELGQ